jgi:hypothetical protein
MTLSTGQLRIAEKIDAKMQTLLRAGKDDVAIMVAMADHMPKFKRLLDTTKPAEMDELTRKFTGFYRYAKILETLAAGIHSGAIKVPR